MSAAYSLAGWEGGACLPIPDQVESAWNTQVPAEQSEFPLSSGRLARPTVAQILLATLMQLEHLT